MLRASALCFERSADGAALGQVPKGFGPAGLRAKSRLGYFFLTALALVFFKLVITVLLGQPPAGYNTLRNRIQLLVADPARNRPS